MGGLFVLAEALGNIKARLNEQQQEWQRLWARAAHRHLLRTSGLVPAVVSAAGRARRALAEDRRQVPQLRRGFTGARVFASLQPHEPLGVATRPGTRDLLHSELPGAPRRPGRARSERLPGFQLRDLQGAAAYQPGKTRPSVPQSPGDQSSFASARRRRVGWLSSRGEAEYRRKRRRNRAVQFGGRIARCCRRKSFVLWH